LQKNIFKKNKNQSSRLLPALLCGLDVVAAICSWSLMATECKAEDRGWHNWLSGTFNPAWFLAGALRGFCRVVEV